ncbi:NPC intracellular cholesterol transporter 1-like [Pecten maximus]|uniref:NPC intracellular cholesterol transporter 1-like n=1 Tax=Pecten maximus TaxID=6579 RepID=UPI0014589217|nr:NPC intracellular cholesterol transporter 1-like [Pecten maximus]
MMLNCQGLNLHSVTAFLFAAIFFFAQKINADSDRGHCIWYGECTNTSTGRQNCAYNGTAKPMTDPAALSRLQRYCPQLYKGNSTLTCCNAAQLVTMEKSMSLAEELLRNCPSCYYNFLNIFCYLTCDPHQSTSVGVKTQAPNEKGVATVLAVDYAMTTTFADGMFNSCTNVILPNIYGNTDSVMGVLCGCPAANCTAKKLLDFLGSPLNGHSPFEIDFHVQNMSWSRPGMYTLKPMNTSTAACNETFGNFSACSYKDCPAIPVPLAPVLPNISVLYPWPEYRVEQLVITRPDNDTKFKHSFPPPSIGYISFTSLFDKTFMHLLLDLQSKIQNITATYKGKNVSLHDICHRVNSNENCVIISILEYWQNNATRLDEVAMDEYGFFVFADYLDHLLSCAHTPNTTHDHTRLNTTCLGTSGIPIDPWLVMNDVAGYSESKTFVISFIVKNSHNREETGAAEAWEKAYTNFLTNFSSPNMTIKFSIKKPIIGVPHTIFPNPVVTIDGLDSKDVSSAAVPQYGIITLLTCALCTIFIRKM